MFDINKAFSISCSLLLKGSFHLSSFLLSWCLSDLSSIALSLGKSFLSSLGRSHPSITCSHKIISIFQALINLQFSIYFRDYLINICLTCKVVSSMKSSFMSDFATIQHQTSIYSVSTMYWLCTRCQVYFGQPKKQNPCPQVLDSLVEEH